MIEGENLPDCSWKSGGLLGQLVRRIEKKTDVGRDICQPLKLKSWDVFLHDSRGPADENIKKIQSMRP